MKYTSIITRSIIILSALLLSANPLFAQEEQPAQKKDDSIFIINSSKDPAVFPLTAIDCASCQTGKLYSIEVRKLHFTLKNISAKAVKVVKVVRGCPCIEVLTPVSDTVLEAGAELPIEFNITARKLSIGPFNRFLYVEVEGQRLANMQVSGEIVEMFEYTPSKVINLGTFIGDAPWKRTFRLKPLVDSEIKFGAPAENKYFNIILTKDDNEEYVVDVSPKGVMPAKKSKELIEIPIENPKGFGPLQLGVMFNATGWALAIENEIVSIFRKKINMSEEQKVTARIILKSMKIQSASQMRRHGRIESEEDTADITFERVSENEEEEAHPLSSATTWEKHLNDISVSRMPEKVKLEKKASENGIELIFTIPPELLKDKYSIQMPVQHKGKTIGVFTIRIR